MVKTVSRINVSEMSSLSVDDATRLLGQTVCAVKATEYGLVLSFASGALLEVRGSTYGDCALSVDFEAAPAASAGTLAPVPAGATIDWVCEHESNTPRANIVKLAITADSTVVEFRGAEGGEDATWSGSLVLKRTTEPQTLAGRYQVKPGAKMKETAKVVQYVLTGRFEDDSCASFTGCWREGDHFETIYEFQLDL